MAEAAALGAESADAPSLAVVDCLAASDWSCASAEEVADACEDAEPACVVESEALEASERASRAASSLDAAPLPWEVPEVVVPEIVAFEVAAAVWDCARPVESFAAEPPCASCAPEADDCVAPSCVEAVCATTACEEDEPVVAGSAAYAATGVPMSARPMTTATLADLPDFMFTTSHPFEVWPMPLRARRIATSLLRRRSARNHRASLALQSLVP